MQNQEGVRSKELPTKMENFDIQRDTMSCNIILHGYFLAGMFNDVIGLFCSLFIKNRPMSVVTFNSHSRALQPQYVS